jgi:hypothetical protein
MAITCEGYVVNANTQQWRRAGNGSAGLKSKANVHAERVAFGQLPTSSAYLLLQNAYPCSDCHAHFKAVSLNGRSVVIKVEANEGNYSAEHFTDGAGHPILKGSVPCVIYYHEGRASYVTMSDVITGGSAAAKPPAGFPAIPEIL